MKFYHQVPLDDKRHIRASVSIVEHGMNVVWTDLQGNRNSAWLPAQSVYDEDCSLLKLIKTVELVVLIGDYGYKGGSNESV